MKFAVFFIKKNETLKRSISFESIELLHILATKTHVQKNKRKFCDVVFSFPDGEYQKAITVKKLPLYLAMRIQPQNQWKIIK